MNESWIAHLDAKFVRQKDTHAGMKWLLHTWQNWGADYGFYLIISGDIYSIITLTDSGYCTTEKVLVDTKDFGIISSWIEHFGPTNRTYKTD